MTHEWTSKLYSSAYLIALFFSLFTSCTAPESELSLSECEKFRTGFFYPKGEMEYMIERRGTEQIETDMSTGNKFFFNVIWLNACNYSLELVHSLSTDSIGLKRGDKMQIEMIAISDSSYTYRVVVNEKYLESELVRVEK